MSGYLLVQILTVMFLPALADLLQRRAHEVSEEWQEVMLSTWAPLVVRAIEEYATLDHERGRAA